MAPLFASAAAAAAAATASALTNSRLQLRPHEEGDKKGTPRGARPLPPRCHAAFRWIYGPKAKEGRKEGSPMNASSSSVARSLCCVLRLSFLPFLLFCGSMTRRLCVSGSPRGAAVVARQIQPSERGSALGVGVNPIGAVGRPVRLRLRRTASPESLPGMKRRQKGIEAVYWAVSGARAWAQ